MVDQIKAKAGPKDEKPGSAPQNANGRRAKRGHHQGITRDERGQIQPKDKKRAQQNW